MSVAQVMAPLGLLIAGPFADAFGVRLWWVLTGIVIAVMGTSALFVPAIVHIEDRRLVEKSCREAANLYD